MLLYCFFLWWSQSTSRGGPVDGETVPLAWICPAVRSAAWPAVGRRREGLQQELSELVSFPKPTLGCAGSCARASLISLHAFVESLEQQCACVRLRGSSFSCLSCQLDCSLPWLACSHCLTVSCWESDLALDVPITSAPWGWRWQWQEGCVCADSIDAAVVFSFNKKLGGREQGRLW